MSEKKTSFTLEYFLANKYFFFLKLIEVVVYIMYIYVCMCIVTMFILKVRPSVRKIRLCARLRHYCGQHKSFAPKFELF